MNARRAALAAAGLLAALAAGATPHAVGDAPAVLQVYDADAVAAPLGIVTRVPAQTSGGVGYAEASLDLSKARATAAGFTPGPLAESFLQTSVPNPPGYANPTLAIAEYPPTSAFPAESIAGTGAATPSSAPATGAANHYHAVASAAPSATAESAPGSIAVPGALSAEGGTSTAHSEILPDGTVVTTAVASVTGLRIGPAAAPLLTIAAATSRAEVRVPLGRPPVTSLTTTVTGLLVGGVPAALTQDGLRVGDQVPLPSSAIGSFNQALAALQEQGITVRAAPATTTEDSGSATASGAAFEVHYRVLQDSATPTDIGKDEDLLPAQVSATALARRRVPVAAPLDLGMPVEAAGLPAVAPTGADTSAFAVSPTPAALPAAVATVAAARQGPGAGPAGQQALVLPRRLRRTAADAVREGYGVILLLAVVGTIALLVRQRARLTD